MGENSKVIRVPVKRAYPSYIAGLRYPSPDGLDRAEYCASLTVGEKLDLEPEPDNEHDPDAVALYHGLEHLGYIPRKHGWIARALEEGDELICLVDQIGIDEAEPDRAYRVGLMIGIVADGDEPEPLVIHETPEMAAARERAVLEDAARRCCVDGLRVIAYLTLVDGLRSEDEHNIEISVIESRLAACGFARDAELLTMLAELTAKLAPNKSSMARSVNIIAKDESYFWLVYEAAHQIADFDERLTAQESEVIDRLIKAGRTNGWLKP